MGVSNDSAEKWTFTRQASGTLVNEPISDEVACLDIEDASKGRPSDDQVMMLIKGLAGISKSMIYRM